MQSLIREAQKSMLRKVPEIKPGYTVRVHQKIKEMIKEGGEEEGGAKVASKKKAEVMIRERVQEFEGLVVKVSSGEGAEKTITIRKVVEGIGVEKVFPLHSPNIVKIDVKKKGDVRRAKLYYMRRLSGKSARLTETQVSSKDTATEEALLQEAVLAAEKKKTDEAAAAAAKAAETPAA